MKLNKLLFGAAALVAGAAVSAQNVHIGGYMDYTNFALGQKFYNDTKSTDGWEEYGEASAEYGSFYNGRTEINAYVNALNLDFAIGSRLDSSLGEWYNLYHDNASSDNNATMIHQANVKARFWNDQLNFYTGKFEEWNAGYILNGYALGGQNIRDLASRSEGQHFTGVEWVPNMSVANGALVGLRLIAGVPFVPPYEDEAEDANKLSTVYKKVKFMGAYKWLRPNIDFHFGFRPGTYYTGNADYSSDNYTTNYFGEGFVQADLPSLIYGVKLNVSYDIRYREAEATLTDLSTWKGWTTAHYFGVSGTTNLIPGVTMNFEDRAYYADDNYIAINEKLFFDQLAFQFTKPIQGTPYVLGFNVYGMYGQDANGTSFNNDRVSSDAFDDLAMDAEWMQVADHKITGGEPGRYYGAYACPYIQKNFGNGFFKAGVEFQYMYEKSASTYQGITYRIPLAFCFWY